MAEYPLIAHNLRYGGTCPYPGRWKFNCDLSIKSHFAYTVKGMGTQVPIRAVPFRWLNEETGYAEFACGCRGHVNSSYVYRYDEADQEVVLLG